MESKAISNWKIIIHWYLYRKSKSINTFPIQQHILFNSGKDSLEISIYTYKLHCFLLFGDIRPCFHFLLYFLSLAHLLFVEVLWLLSIIELYLLIPWLLVSLWDYLMSLFSRIWFRRILRGLLYYCGGFGGAFRSFRLWIWSLSSC